MLLVYGLCDKSQRFAIIVSSLVNALLMIKIGFLTDNLFKVTITQRR